MEQNKAQTEARRPDGPVTVSTSRNKFVYLTENEALSGDVRIENGSPVSMTLLTKRPDLFVTGSRVAFKNKYPNYSWQIRAVDPNPRWGRHMVACDFPERICSSVPRKKRCLRYTYER